jgi:hypothetical protein
MNQVYRIARMSAGRCGVVRVADNTRVGTFSHVSSELQLTAEKVDVSLMAKLPLRGDSQGM